MRLATLFLLLICFSINIVFAQKDAQKKIQTQLIEAADGTTIEIPEGRFQFDASLSLDGKKNVIIKGAGIEKTILNFKDQLSGAEGIKITNASNITLQDLTVQDTKGDGIKAQLVEGITFKNVKAEWTTGGSSKNGGYGCILCSAPTC
jgi:parallel beta-helix repeat protein